MENSFGQNKRAKIKKKIFQILTHAILILCSISMLIPFLWMISSSLKDVQELYAIPPYWIPKHVAWENYVYMFEQAPWFVYFGNTIFITVFTILGQLITCSMAAYAFARLNFKGKNILCSDEENLCTNAKLLQQKGVKNIVVTLGGEGSYLLKEDHTEKRLYADKTVHVVDTTAAGDSYVAGLAVALSRGDSLDEAVELASRVSNIVVTRKGAQPSIPSFEELEEAPE